MPHAPTRSLKKGNYGIFRSDANRKRPRWVRIIPRFPIYTCNPISVTSSDRRLEPSLRNYGCSHSEHRTLFKIAIRDALPRRRLPRLDHLQYHSQPSKIPTYPKNKQPIDEDTSVSRSQQRRRPEAQENRISSVHSCAVVIDNLGGSSSRIPHGASENGPGK